MFENLKKDLLVKITAANALLVVSRMGFSVISQKILAIFIGAEGIALVGNFKNVINYLALYAIAHQFRLMTAVVCCTSQQRWKQTVV